MVHGQPREDTFRTVVQVEPGAALGGPGAMNKVTLYVKDGDREIWDRAKRVLQANESLSTLVAEGLEVITARRERVIARVPGDAGKMERIELEGFDYADQEKRRRVRFVGAFVPSDAPEANLYVTRAGAVVVDRLTPFTTIETFNDFDVFRVSAEGWILATDIGAVAEALGEEYFEEID